MNNNNDDKNGAIAAPHPADNQINELIRFSAEVEGMDQINLQYLQQNIPPFIPSTCLRTVFRSPDLEASRITNEYLYPLFDKFTDDVYAADYNGMIDSGIHVSLRGPSKFVIQALGKWYRRLPSESNHKMPVEQALVNLIARRSSFVDAKECLLLTIEEFPELKHDMIQIFFYNAIFSMSAMCEGVYKPDFCRRRLVPCRSLLVDHYPPNNENDNEPFCLVVMRAFLLSLQQSRYPDSVSFLSLRVLIRWIIVLKRMNPLGAAAFKVNEAFIFHSILQSTSFEAVDWLDTGAPGDTSGNNHCTHWKQVLSEFGFGSNEMSNDALQLARTLNHHGQLPLHVFLAQGLPGVKILVKANPEAVEERCPVTELYPFELAAVKRDLHDSAKESLKDQLDREQLSKIYLLIRDIPQVIKECDLNKASGDRKSVLKKLNAKPMKIAVERYEERTEKMKQVVLDSDQEINNDENRFRKEES